MSRTILSARYANEDRTAVILVTAEAGEVLISEPDRPELWQQMLDSGIAIGPKQAYATGMQDAHPQDMGSPKVLRAREQFDAERIDIFAQNNTLREIRWTFGEVGQKIAKHLHTQHDSHVSIVTQGAFLVRITGEEDLIVRRGDHIDWPGGIEHEWEVIEAPAQLFNVFKPRG